MRAIPLSLNAQGIGASIVMRLKVSSIFLLKAPTDESSPPDQRTSQVDTTRSVPLIHEHLFTTASSSLKKASKVFDLTLNQARQGLKWAA